MTVKELIERLEGMNPDSEVVLAKSKEGKTATTIDSVWTKDGYTCLDGGMKKIINQIQDNEKLIILKNVLTKLTKQPKI